MEKEIRAQGKPEWSAPSLTVLGDVKTLTQTSATESPSPDGGSSFPAIYAPS